MFVKVRNKKNTEQATSTPIVMDFALVAILGVRVRGTTKQNKKTGTKTGSDAEVVELSSYADNVTNSFLLCEQKKCSHPRFWSLPRILSLPTSSIKLLLLLHLSLSFCLSFCLFYRPVMLLLLSSQASQALRNRQHAVRSLLAQKCMPSHGWKESMIEALMQEVSMLDSNNFLGDD